MGAARRRRPGARRPVAAVSAAGLRIPPQSPQVGAATIKGPFQSRGSPRIAAGPLTRREGPTTEVTSDDSPNAPVRAVRADVRRNRARLIAAARETFQRDGADASLEGVARLAGVGIGTLYRHFPTRQDLLEALLADAYGELAARARELAESPSPGEALMEWLRAFVSAVTAFRGMAAAAVVSLGEDRAEASRAVREAGESLFDRAGEAGDVPPGTAFIDVLRLSGAIAAVTEQDPRAAERLLSLAAAGMIPGRRAAPH